VRGQELGLTGSDLLIYQTGEIARAGVHVEQTTRRWVESALAFHPEPDTQLPNGYSPLIKTAKGIATRIPVSDDVREAMRSTFAFSLDAMQRRNRLIHDQWESFDEWPDNWVRFGYFPDSGIEVNPGIGPAAMTPAHVEECRTDLFRALHRLSAICFLIPDQLGLSSENAHLLEAAKGNLGF
jgi:hypothetical protein